MSSTSVDQHPALNGEVEKTLSTPAVPSVPPPKPVAQNASLMHKIASGVSEAKIAGTLVKNLSASPTTPSEDASASPGEFVVKGTIDLFGRKDLTAELDIWQGSPPAGVTVGSATPSVQRAVVKGNVKLSQLVPSLSTGSFGSDLTFENVSFYHQNYAFDSNRSIGYELDADLVLASCGPLTTILSKILAVNDPTLSIRAAFGPDQSWNGPLTVNALTITGSFIRDSFTPTTGTQITSISVRLTLERNPDKDIVHDLEVFGALNLTVPGATVPLELDYTLKDVSGGVQLSATLPSGASWMSPMGAQGLVLNTANFSTTLSLSNPWKDFTLDVAAQLSYQTSVLTFTGSYVPKAEFSLNATIEKFDLATLDGLYQAIHHEPLKAPRLNVTIQSAVLSIDSHEGFSAKLTNIDVEGYASANATVAISTSGSLIHADLGTIKFGELITLASGYIQLDLQPASSTKSSDATIYGDVKFETLDLNVAVHIYQSAPDATPKRTEWTVYAELASSGNTLALSKIEPRLMNTAFDLALKDVVFVAASQDDPEIGAIVPSTYKFTEGVQVFATMDEIPVFDALSKSNVTGLILHAAWSKSSGFSLGIVLPVARNLNLGKGITTTPISLSLDLTPSPIQKDKLVPALQVAAGLYIPVAHSPAPLLFEMVLTAMDTDATIAAELKGNWVDPFGISNEVVVGPDLILQADISYVTGLSGMYFKGGLAIGSTDANVAVSVNEDPMKEMLYAEVDNLNFSDVVAFAEKLVHAKLPPPPRDFLYFEKVKVYMCPAGLTVQGVTYPPGFSFESDMLVFGKHVNVSCDTADSILSINGAVDNFEIGPLKVNGLNGAKQAIVQVKVGKNVQHLLLDGAITLYAESYGLHLLVDTQPSPVISFMAEFKFTEMFTFEVSATLIGALNFKDLSKADFSFDADLEQHLLDYIHDEVIKLLNIAEQAVEQGVKTAEKRVDDEKAALQGKINQAQQHLDAAKATWDAHQKSIMDVNNKVIADYNAKIKSLQDTIASTEKAYNAALQKAQSALTNAQHDRQVKMQAAENAVADAKKKAASDIQNAKNQVAAATASMNRDFGSAENSIRDAQNKVNSIQGQINDINRQIHDLENGPWWKKPAIGGLEIARGTLEGSLRAAQGVLDAARAVLRSSNYLARKTAMQAAQSALDLAQKAGPALISAAQASLEGVDKVTQASVKAASDGLTAVQHGTEKIAFDNAQKALTTFKLTGDVLVKQAFTNIANLTKSVEYVAYEAATTALTVAKASTQSLDAAQAVLKGAEASGAGILEFGKLVVTEGTKAFNITSVHLSGSLGKSVKGDALAADIKGVVVGKPFEISGELDPRRITDFLTHIFNEVKQHLIESALHH